MFSRGGAPSGLFASSSRFFRTRRRNQRPKSTRIRTPTMPATGRPITFICPSSSLSSCCGPGAGRGRRQRASVLWHLLRRPGPVALASRRLGSTEAEASREGRVGGLGRLGSLPRARPSPPRSLGPRSAAPAWRGRATWAAVRGRPAAAAGSRGRGGCKGGAWPALHAPAGSAPSRGEPAWPGGRSEGAKARPCPCREALSHGSDSGGRTSGARGGRAGGGDRGESKVPGPVRLRRHP